MANSRSNIYPIQLQGAELCLNRYDAEIKQYSGFNKNNSPFVGGCLSNVFTKDTALEGATDDNTYIDENGDVYSVDTEGMYKNGEKLIDLTGKKFYDVVDCKTQFPNNTVYVDSEECYITLTYKRGTGYMNENLALDWHFHIYNPFSEQWDVVDVTNLPSDSNSIIVQFYTRSCRFENHILTFVAVLFNGYIFNQYFITTETGTEVNELAAVTDSDCESIIIHHVKTDDTTGIFVVIRNEKTGGLKYYKYNYDINNETVVTRNNTQYSLSEYIAAESKLYKIGHSGSISTPYEEVLFDYVFQNESTADASFIKSNPKTVNHGTIGSLGSTTYYVSNKKTFGFLLTQAEDITSGGSSATKRYGMCDFVSPFMSAETIDGNNQVVFNMGAVTGEYVLYNNRIVSGICLPGGYVLASEWNSVEEHNIYVQKYKKNYEGVYTPSDCEVIYKTGNRWVKLIESTPRLKCINNQVVVNTNHYMNAYDFKRNKKLLFAPAWNNRAPAAYSAGGTSNTNYLASAINEYNLADNCSLLLNPIPVTNVPVLFSSVEKPINAVEDNIYVDVYEQLPNETEIKYVKSVLISDFDFGFKQFRFEKLVDLPFPVNTDGNVQYSPSIFCDVSTYGTEAFIREGENVYQLMKSNNQLVMSYFLGTLVEGLQIVFIIQGQYYGIIGNNLFSIQFQNGVLSNTLFIIDVSNLQFVGNTPYEALFYSKTNRCLYSFTGANVLNQKQLVDKISEVRQYLYNPATQTVFLITDIGVLFYGLFGVFLLEYTDITKVFLLDNGVVLSNNNGGYRYVKYYLDDSDEDYIKQNILVETCFYGMNNQTVTINDCLYFRLFSEEHEEGDLKVSATTISLRGRKTEETTFKIKASDWDKITHTIYLRYQPKEQRGLGVSFSIDSPFKIASLSVGSQPDAILIDKVSKGAINAPSRTSNNDEW